ncbi:MAG: polysaccharide deacetylase family protein [Verrucomicrobiales bacterium]
MISNPRHRLMGGLILGALGLAILGRGHFWWGLLAFFPAHAALLWAGLVPACQWLGRVVTSFRVSDGERFVWLTIDDGPEPGGASCAGPSSERTGLAPLSLSSVRKPPAIPHLIRRILAEGHLLGNHTQSHPEKWFWTLPGKRVARELDECTGTLLQITGSTPGNFPQSVGMKPPL